MQLVGNIIPLPDNIINIIHNCIQHEILIDKETTASKYVTAPLDVDQLSLINNTDVNNKILKLPQKK